MTPNRAYAEGFCATAYPYTPTEQPAEDVQEAWEAGCRDAGRADQERADLEYLREINESCKAPGQSGFRAPKAVS